MRINKLFSNKGICSRKQTNVWIEAGRIQVKNNIIEYMAYPEFIFPVGRLDKDSQGLILMTNDGDLANQILDADSMH